MTLPMYDVVTVTLNPAIDLKCSIDGFILGAVNRVAAFQSVAGGKGVNVASSLAGAGHRVTATGFLGNGNRSLFDALFRSREIDDHFLRLPGCNRFGIKITDGASNETTDINFPGISPADEHISALLQSLEVLDAKWFVLAGSLPPGIPASFYQQLTRSLKQRGKRVALDASGDALRLALTAGPDMIKPNRHELEDLLGTPLTGQSDVLEAARFLSAKFGIANVVVSMGGDGALFVRPNESLLAVPPQVPVVSTVGAGDAMVAGWISARLRELPLAETARLATAFSLNVLTHAETGISSMESVRQFIPQVTVHNLSVQLQP